MIVSIRKFEKTDIPNKVRWINDPRNHTYLHYDLPLEIEKTENWFEKNRDRTDRYDAVIEADGVPVGVIGLLSIDLKYQKAEYYVTLGECSYQGKGIAAKATELLLEYAFGKLGLNRVYLYMDADNLAAEKLYERVGFRREGVLRKDLFRRGHFVDRCVYGMTRDDFYGGDTPVYRIDRVFENNLYIKREDLIPVSFGGNKARKAQLFFREIDHGGYNCVVTYGSSSSNHCRVISNLAVAREIPCYIISPEEASEETYNSVMMKNFKAEITVCPVCDVHDTIETKIEALEQRGYRPYFIAGGGHGNTGTQAYVNCYEEIRQYEKEHHCYFDYIFHASGTGTTQAGLVCGQLIHKEERKIIGISIARKKDVGREVILHSIKDYLYENKIDTDSDEIEKAVIFEDTYVGDGYGSTSPEIDKMIHFVLKQYGIPLDTTYTGKAFYGMMQYLKQNCISHKNVLFLHTGGTPLFFDDLKHTSGDWKGK